MKKNVSSSSTTVATRYKLCVAYNGNKYLGFQRQKTTKTEKRLAIQNVLEQRLSMVYRRFVPITAAGRTDRGVHAAGQVITFDLLEQESQRIEPLRLLGIVNRLLPQDIRLLSIRKVSSFFHSRHHATARHYRYQLFVCDKNQTATPDQLYCTAIWPYAVNIHTLNEYLSFFQGQNDFSTFCSPLEPSKNRERIIYIANAHQSHLDPQKIIIDFIGNAFLRAMVRSIVGNVLTLMKNEERPFIIKKLLREKNPALAKHRACPNGLSLVGVFYTPIFSVFQTSNKTI